MIERLDWDSRHFGLEIGKVVGAPIHQEEYKRYDCVYWLIDAADDCSLRTAAEDGFRLVDTRVTLSCPFSGSFFESTYPGVDSFDSIYTNARKLVRPVMPISDTAGLIKLARNSHRSSRFFCDSGFSPKISNCMERAQALFELWIRRALAAHVTGIGKVLVTGDVGNPDSYCSIVQNQIDLLAVSRSCQRQGVGTALVICALAEIRSKRLFEEALVVTQGRNVSALNFYHHCGFGIKSVQHWFHRWKRPQ